MLTAPGSANLIKTPEHTNEALPSRRGAEDPPPEQWQSVERCDFGTHALP